MRFSVKASWLACDSPGYLEPEQLVFWVYVPKVPGYRKTFKSLKILSFPHLAWLILKSQSEEGTRSSGKFMLLASEKSQDAKAHCSCFSLVVMLPALAPRQQCRVSGQAVSGDTLALVSPLAVLWLSCVLIRLYFPKTLPFSSLPSWFCPNSVDAHSKVRPSMRSLSSLRSRDFTWGA